MSRFPPPPLRHDLSARPCRAASPPRPPPREPRVVMEFGTVDSSFRASTVSGWIARELDTGTASSGKCLEINSLIDE